ncbi:MAG TPA: exo-beta-N-acetylmuramidase NamZ domain-containing protein, partial [Polyangiales bacterium]|nr:exo-beta-N-acetylmuramidase NamZ domain-containing protein [Polyangiales bacterium]
MSPRVQTGLDRIARGDPDALRELRGRRVGLCAHPASIDAQLRHARFVLESAGVRVRALFGPEHGYGGEAQDMIAVGEEKSAREDVPVYSLYGASEEELSPRAEQLEDLDAVVIDLQDVGSRYYTFVWTAVLVLRAAVRAGVQTIVLDRPNPLGGVVLEGAPQRPGYRSFVGLRDVAVRHGMTIGELCRMAQLEEKLDAEALRVVPMLGYQRELSFR